MKKILDWEKAKQLIAEEKDVESVEGGLAEDWFWTADTIFKEGKFIEDNGVYDSSLWATPIVRFFYKDGKQKDVDCWKEDED